LILKVLQAEFMGFCFGVQNAVSIVNKEIEGKSENIQILGPIVHNPQQVAVFEKAGVKTVDTVAEAKPGVLIIRAHGVTPKVLSEANSRKDLTVIDATCPLVKMEQNFAKKLYDEGYKVIIVGEKNHPEAIGVKGYTNNEGIIIESEEQAQDFPFSSQKIGVVVQTTMLPSKVEGIIKKIFEKGVEIRIFNTICNPTKQHHPSAVKIANESDVMIVIGGKNSSNTKRLAELCSSIKPTYHVESVDEIKKEWFTSTPSFVINEVVNYLDKLVV
jgi:4-hydroxy-3-methylbut-2-enyl diphosphate reductase